MRVFIALEMPDADRDRLRPCLAQLARESREVKWMAVQNLHLTLKFLGEVSGELLSDLNTALAAIAKGTAPFVLRYERVGFFRSGGGPSVIWLGITRHDQLQALAEQVALGSERLIRTDDRRPFRPHITLGRVRQPYGGPPLPAVLERIDAGSLPDWTVHELSLIRSELTPRGPVYTVISRHQLGGE